MADASGERNSLFLFSLIHCRYLHSVVNFSAMLCIGIFKKLKQTTNVKNQVFVAFVKLYPFVCKRQCD